MSHPLSSLISKVRWSIYVTRVKLSTKLSPLWRTQPAYPSITWKNGGPIDRYYIEKFLERYRNDVHDVVLEAGGAVDYTRRFGGDRVTQAEVLYPRPGFPDGTLVGDLMTGEGLTEASFDCLILTHVFTYLYDLRAAAATCRRLLRPGGVMLAAVPGLAGC